MAIKGGNIIHVGNGDTLISRVQTGGPGQVNIPTEKINELGNYKSVATARDVPDLTFTMESFDVSTDVERMLCGLTATPAGGIDLATSVPLDIASQFKAGQDAAAAFDIVGSVALPYLRLEQMSYRFGLKDNATQSASLRGDTIFYNPGATFVEEVAGTNLADQEVVTEHPAYEVHHPSETRRVLSVTAGGKRLNLGADYTETYGTTTAGAATTTITVREPVPVAETIRIVYASPDVVSYPQSVHPSTAVKPAAVKGKDIEIYLGAYDKDDRPGSAPLKLGSVQAVTVEWRVTIEKDEEFGNYYAVAVDFSDVPQVSGTVDLLPEGPAGLQALIRKALGVADATKVVGTQSSTPQPLHVVIKHPDTGAIMKRINVPDARFTPPGYTGRVTAKTTVTLNFESDEGTLLIFDA